jgi:hypothetical protein
MSKPATSAKLFSPACHAWYWYLSGPLTNTPSTVKSIGIVHYFTAHGIGKPSVLNTLHIYEQATHVTCIYIALFLYLASRIRPPDR